MLLIETEFSEHQNYYNYNYVGANGQPIRVKFTSVHTYWSLRGKLQEITRGQ